MARRTTWLEPARNVPVVEETDVLVCGGGPAGVAAAIAAARAGASTRLIEMHGCLGGIWTAGLLGWILDAVNKPGLLQEILQRLEKRGARQKPCFTGIAVDVEQMKLLLEEMCLEAGVRIRLHTRVAAAWPNGGRTLGAVVTESKSGREAWIAKVVIDATGDGDVAALAGCAFEFGRNNSGETQPMSLIALLAGVRYEDIRLFAHTEAAGRFRDDSNRLLAALKPLGIEPSYGAPILMRIHDDLFAMMANHEYGVSALSAQQITDATIRARAEINRIVNGLRSLGGPWAGLRLVATAEQIGVREGRRIRGIYTVSADDLINGARHEDAICRVTFPVDVHSTRASAGKAFSDEKMRARPYDIPLRALIARDVDGLMMAGRCISGDFIAHSSYRVTGNAVAMGQAAGTTAALAARNGVKPQDVPFAQVKQLLER